MYLEREIYIGAEYAHNNINGEINLTKGKDNKIIELPPLSELSSIKYKVAYWRKANAIHSWLTKDNDDDITAEHSGKHLLELVDICKKVKKSLEESGLHKIKTIDKYTKKEIEIEVYKDTSFAEELLPSQSGFFFGRTEYDEWYMYSLDETIEQLKDVDEDEYYIYTASY